MDHSPLVASSLALTPSYVNVSPSSPLIVQEINSFSILENNESVLDQIESVMPSPVNPIYEQYLPTKKIFFGQ